MVYNALIDQITLKVNKMRAKSMYVGGNELPPLSEFTVTVKSFVKPKKEKVAWHEWYRNAGWPDYEVMNGYQIVFSTEKEPNDVEVELPPNNPPYEIVWAT